MASQLLLCSCRVALRRESRDLNQGIHGHWRTVKWVWALTIPDCLYTAYNHVSYMLLALAVMLLTYVAWCCSLDQFIQGHTPYIYIYIYEWKKKKKIYIYKEWKKNIYVYIYIYKEWKKNICIYIYIYIYIYIRVKKKYIYIYKELKKKIYIYIYIF